MLKGLNGVIYQVSDIEKAKEWYGKVFNTKPVIDTSFAVLFLIGDALLGLTPATDTTVTNYDRVIAYWNTDDIESDYERLLELGATKHTEIRVVTGGRAAAVIDPFGNILGISIREIVTSNQSVEHQPSQSAMGVATVRAIAFIEEREEIKGPDYLAEIFLTDDRKAFLNDQATWKSMMAEAMPGLYEHIIARTTYFDNIVQQALHENIPQIVFLGAGYDTRSFRFKDLIKDTRIFELDIHTTQKQKIKLLRQNNISIPRQLTFVPINFNTETLEDVLLKAGYKKDQKNLFIWEGVTYYLSPQVIDDTLDFIKSNSSTGSTVCFDYNVLWPEMMDAYGVRKSMETMRTYNPGEPGRFGIERGKIESFLSDRGYKIIDHLTAEEIERKFLTLRDGSLAGKVMAIFCLAHASVSE